MISTYATYGFFKGKIVNVVAPKLLLLYIVLDLWYCISRVKTITGSL